MHKQIRFGYMVVLRTQLIRFIAKIGCVVPCHIPILFLCVHFDRILRDSLNILCHFGYTEVYYMFSKQRILRVRNNANIYWKLSSTQCVRLPNLRCMLFRHSSCLSFISNFYTLFFFCYQQLDMFSNIKFCCSLIEQ